MPRLSILKSIAARFAQTLVARVEAREALPRQDAPWWFPGTVIPSLWCDRCEAGDHGAAQPRAGTAVLFVLPFGRPSIDPVLMIRRLIIGYAHANHRRCVSVARTTGCLSSAWSLIAERHPATPKEQAGIGEHATSFRNGFADPRHPRRRFCNKICQ